MSYGVAESLVGDKGFARNINGVEIRFPVRYSRYYEVDYEPITFKFLQKNCQTGGTFLDCGAHIGLFAVVGAKMVGETGKVFSFEPTPNTRKVLEEVVKINKCSDIVEVRAEAISKESGTATFFETGEDVSNANSLVQTKRHGDGLTVPTISIDALVEQNKLKIDVIKIDVEGSELAALQGGVNTFEKYHPPLSLGLHPNAIKEIGATLGEIWDFLIQFDYEITYEGKVILKDWFIEQDDLFDVQCYSNIKNQE